MSNLIGVDGRRLKRPRYDLTRGLPNIEVVGPWLMLMPARRSEVTLESGIVIPEHAQEQLSIGVVMLVGDGRMLPDGTVLPPRVEPGWEVLHARYAGVEVTLDDITYLMIQESEVRCILTYAGRYFTPQDSPDSVTPISELS